MIRTAFLPPLSRLCSTATMTLTPRISPQTPQPSAKPANNLFLDASKAVLIDQKLMSPPYQHTLEQLMELAGLAVAHAIADIAPPTPVCLICGPGNNGGDGLVAARHLTHFGYPVTLIYPKPQARPPFQNLLQQLRMLDVEVRTTIPRDCRIVVDAIFGFSFRGEAGVREPFQSVIEMVNEFEGAVVSVDIPSGWHVDRGPVWDCCIRNPAAVISLTAPKLCMKGFEGVHYVGGRFIPPRLTDELGFAIPKYEGTSGIARIA